MSEPLSEMTKLAILSSSLETWVFDNVTGFAESQLRGGRNVKLEGRLNLDALAEYILRRVRDIEDARV